MQLVKHQEEIDLYTIENEHLRVELLNVGASIYRFIVKAKDLNIVTNHKNIQEYIENPGNLGAVIGMNANRIEKAAFSLAGKSYKLEANESPHNLHSGEKSLQHTIFKVFQETPQKIKFTTDIADLEDDFPGHRQVTICYQLKNKDLIIDYHVTTDQKTVVNLTNHAYFNLQGSSSMNISNHDLQLNSDFYMPIHAGGLPSQEIHAVANTPFDFRQANKIKEALESQDPQINLAQGIDHTFLIRRGDEPAATLVNKDSKLTLQVFTDQTSMQIYTANHFNPEEQLKNENNLLFEKHGAICIETQYIPNAINTPWLEKPIYDEHKPYSSRTVYRIICNQQ